jgi:hypothetical protein
LFVMLQDIQSISNAIVHLTNVSKHKRRCRI